MDPENQRRNELREERMQEWQTRRRGPGDLVTWAVVLGGLTAVLVFFSAAYDGSVATGAAVTIVIVAWTLVVWVPGGVNVLAVLWGRASDPDISPVQARIVLLASTALAALAVMFLILDLVTSLDFGWYGRLAAVVGLVTLALIARSGRLRG